MITCSIIKDTNRAVGSFDANWASIRPDSFIKFGKDAACYTVAKAESFFYIKDFTTDGSNRILVNDDIGINLTHSDIIDISYKEYELLTVIKPLSGGAGYSVGNKISLDGGVSVQDAVSGINSNSTFVVSHVDANGGITQIKLESKGRYVICPPKECGVIGGNGSGAILLTDYKLLDSRALVERSILDAQHNGAQTTLVLDAPLPNGVTEGKLSLEKWQLFLTGNYVGETKVNVVYTVSRDFTPNFKLPLLLKGSNSPEVTYNQAIKIIDEEMQSMWEDIEKIKHHEL